VSSIAVVGIGEERARNTVKQGKCWIQVFCGFIVRKETQGRHWKNPKSQPGLWRHGQIQDGTKPYLEK
jgi:hypothetical protein